MTPEQLPRSSPGNETTVIMPGVVRREFHASRGTHHVSTHHVSRLPRRNSMTNPIRVLIVDDHAMVRRGLAAFLKAKPDLLLVGEASNGGEAISLCERLQPDVVLMDLMMPGMGGAEATQVIVQALARGAGDRLDQLRGQGDGARGAGGGRAQLSHQERLGRRSGRSDPIRQQRPFDPGGRGRAGPRSAGAGRVHMRASTSPRANAKCWPSW